MFGVAEVCFVCGTPVLREPQLPASEGARRYSVQVQDIPPVSCPVLVAFNVDAVQLAIGDNLATAGKSRVQHGCAEFINSGEGTIITVGIAPHKSTSGAYPRPVG